jgi:hypothetical protein
LYAGGLLGVFAVPFYLAGYWLIYKALRPGGFWAAFHVVLTAGYGILLGFSQVHSFFGIRGIMLQTGAGISPEFVDLFFKPIVERIASFEVPIVILTYGLGIVVPSLWTMVVILIRKTRYPRWTASINVVTVFIVLSLSRFVSQQLYSVLGDIAVNVGHAVFFLIPTVLLWNETKEATRSR